MRTLLLLLAATAVAQSGPRIESPTPPKASAASARYPAILHGPAAPTAPTCARPTRGRTWTPAQVPDATALDFRAVVAFSATEAFLMSAGPGDQSRIYHTSDAGQHWQLQFTNTNPKGFFDSMVFWDSKHGVVLGDPIPDESGKLKFEFLTTDDGQTWRQIPPAQFPPAIEGEGAFAARNSCIAILHSNLWKSGPSAPRQAAEEGASAPRGPTSGSPPEARSPASSTPPTADKLGKSSTLPSLHGPESAGIFSIAFRDPHHGVIAGGDYKHPNDDGPNLAFTDDGGKTWNLSDIIPSLFLRRSL